MRKFRNIKVEYEGIKFDSKIECQRYMVLKKAAREGKITMLRLQDKFVLIKAQRDANGKYVYPCTYKADFSYYKGDKLVVEDVKGREATKTPEYRIKSKLMLERYGITIHEVTKDNINEV